MNRLRIALAVAALAVGFGAAPLSAQVAGDWSGSISTPGGDLSVVLHVVEADDALSATMDSPDQGAYGFVASTTTFVSDTLTIEFAEIGGSYVATVSDEGLTGSWSQGGMTFDLDLVPHESEAESED